MRHAQAARVTTAQVCKVPAKGFSGQREQGFFTVTSFPIWNVRRGQEFVAARVAPGHSRFLKLIELHIDIHHGRERARRRERFTPTYVDDNELSAAAQRHRPAAMGVEKSESVAATIRYQRKLYKRHFVDVCRTTHRLFKHIIRVH